MNYDWREKQQSRRNRTMALAITLSLYVAIGGIIYLNTGSSKLESTVHIDPSQYKLKGYNDKVSSISDSHLKLTQKNKKIIP